MTTAQDHNGPFTRPREGSKTGEVWDLCDKLHAKGVSTRREVYDIAKTKGMRSGTVSCQLPRWEHNTGHQLERVHKKSAKTRKPMAGKVSGDASAIMAVVRAEMTAEIEYAAAKVKWVEATKARKELIK